VLRYDGDVAPYEVFVRKLRHPLATEVVKTMQRYVRQFIERQTAVKERGQHARHPGGEAADRLHVFLKGMETASQGIRAYVLPCVCLARSLRRSLVGVLQELRKNPLWREEAEEQWAETRESLERFVMCKLRRHLFTRPEARELAEQDRALAARLRALAFLGPEHLDIKSVRAVMQACVPAMKRSGRAHRRSLPQTNGISDV
jgi:hypothetical protein